MATKRKNGSGQRKLKRVLKGKQKPDAQSTDLYNRFHDRRHARTGESFAREDRNRKKANPAAESLKAYKDFHGRDSEELVKVTKEIHYHRHLAGAGKLEKLIVEPLNGGRVTLSGFKGAILAYNEKRTQLFVEGGDQTVDLKAFGVRVLHEQEVLGEVMAVEYFTTKDHLRAEDGGTAIYHHKFEKPRPTLIYDVINKQLSFAGGRYTIPDEGIDN